MRDHAREQSGKLIVSIVEVRSADLEIMVVFLEGQGIACILGSERHLQQCLRMLALRRA